MTCNLIFIVGHICRYQELKQKKKNIRNLLQVSVVVKYSHWLIQVVRHNVVLWLLYMWSSSDLFVLAQGTQGNTDPSHQESDGESADN